MLPPKKLATNRTPGRVFCGLIFRTASHSEGQKIRGADLIPNSASQTLVKFAVNLSVNCPGCQQVCFLFLPVLLEATGPNYQIRGARQQLCFLFLKVLSPRCRPKARKERGQENS